MTLARRGAAVVVALTIVGALAVSPVAQAQTAATPGTPLPASDVKVTRQVEFAEVGGITLTLDVYQPNHPSTGLPAVILVHGGAWGNGKSQDVADEAKLVAREGWVAFSVNYRLVGDTPTPWPDELTDVQRSIRWVGAHAADYGVDANKLALLGVSAGGHLAILAGQIGTAVDGTGQTIDDPDPAAHVRAVAAWSPPTKLSGLTTPADADAPPDCANNKACTEFWRLPLVSSFIGCSIEKCPKDYDTASPLYRITQDEAPVWFSNGTEELVPLIQAQELDRAMLAAHVNHHLEVIDGSGHADQDESKVWNDMMAWLAARLGVPTPPPISFAGRNLLLSPVVVISVIIGLALLILLFAIALRDDEGDL
jgi:acetyl esterase/lipase